MSKHGSEKRRRAVARRLLGHRRLPVAVVAVAVALCLPSLWLGLQLDDHILRLALTNPPPIPYWSKGPADAFAFFTGDAAVIRQYMDTGILPWWTLADFRVAFLRPLAGLTHWIDFRLWPERVEVMHVHSLLWFGAMVVAASAFFRRFMRSYWIAGLAALVFALDDAHGMPAAWLANRNASIATCFGILTLIAHDGWRRSGSRWGMVLSPVAFILALLGGELGIATAAYLFAYALFLDEGTWRDRLASLLPAAAVSVAWALAYSMLGFGVSGSALYVDPAHPGRFAAAVVERGPILLFGQWFLSADLYNILSQRAARILWLAACGLLVLLAVLLAPLVRRDRVARFFGAGMVLSVLPACGTFPNGRLLMFVGLGGAGLLAQFLAARIERTSWLPRARAWRGLAAGAFLAFVALHLVLAPVGLMLGSSNIRALGAIAERAAASMPSDPAVRGQRVVVVNTPNFFVSVFGPTLQLLHGRPIAQRTLILASGIYPMRVRRPADNVLVIRPEGGFLAPAGSPRPGEESSQPAVNVDYAYQMLDELFRDATPFRVGDRVELAGVVIEIAAITGDGRPAEAVYRFDVSLDDASLRWLRWSDGVYVPFPVPRVGETAELPPATVPARPPGQ